MTINAKYPGRCKSCGGAISIGDSVEWSKGSGARHVSCERAPQSVPRVHASSRRRAPAAPRKAGVIVSDPAIIETIHSSRCGVRDASTLVGETWRAGSRCGKVAGQIVTVIGAETWYQSDEDNDDMGDMRGGGWGATQFVRLATETEAASVVRAETEKADAQAKAAAAAKDADARLKGLRTPPEGWVMVDGASIGDFSVALTDTDGSTEVIHQQAPTLPADRKEWVLLGEARQESSYATLYQAGEYRVLDHGSYDDYRTAVMIPSHLVDAYMAAEVARRGITRETAVAWLAQYRGCVGTEVYAWAETHLA